MHPYHTHTYGASKGAFTEYRADLTMQPVRIQSPGNLELQQLRQRLRSGEKPAVPSVASPIIGSSSALTLEQRIAASQEDLKRLKAMLLQPDSLGRLTGGSATQQHPQHLDPCTTSTRNGGAEAHSALRQQLPPEAISEEDRAKVLLQWVQDLRLECRSLTEEVVASHAPGTFSEFFVNGESMKGDGASKDNSSIPKTLPSPPPVDVMLDRFHALQEHSRQLAVETAVRSDMERHISYLRKQATASLQGIADKILVRPPPSSAAPAVDGKKIHQDPIEVYGLSKTPGHPPFSVPPPHSERVSQFVKEVHAFQLLCFIMRAAPAYDEVARRISTNPSTSRGSSETPSITPITSVADQSVFLPGVQHGSTAHGATAMVSASTMLLGNHNSSHLNPRTQQQRGDPTGVSFFSPNHSHQQTSLQQPGKNIQFAFGPDVSTRGGTEASRSSKAATVVGTNAAAPRDTSTSDGASTSTNTAVSADVRVVGAKGGTVASSESNPSAVSPSPHHDGASTVHDTSTAATQGADSSGGGISVAAAAGGSTNPAPTVRSGWSEGRAGSSTTDRNREHNQSSSSTATSRSQREKKKRSIFSCMRRSDDDDDD